MKILRLFIDQELSQTIPWVVVDSEGVVVDSEGVTNSGTSTFEELSQFEEMALEIYLSTNCCSIFKTNIKGIHGRNLSEELILGILEDGLVDDINQVKPVMLSGEDNTAYVAIFNRNYYTELIGKLINLNKPIRFLQSFAYAVLYKENSWTIFWGEEQSFIRTSKYEYYCLDDSRPIPLLLSDMLAESQPQSLLVYTDNPDDFKILESELKVPIVNVNDQFEFGVPVWNFYNQKSTTFNIKLAPVTKTSLFRLFRISIYLFVALATFWLLNVINLEVNTYRLKSQLENSLHNIMPLANISSDTLNSTLNTLRNKVADERHNHGLYASDDAVTLLYKFLEIVSDITDNSITEIDYNKGEMQIFINNLFNPQEFVSYTNIFAINHISASIKNYTTYLKEKKLAMAKIANNDNDDDDALTSKNTTWVITLRPSSLQN